MSRPDVVLDALESELKRAKKAAANAKAAADEYNHVGTEMLAIHEELKQILVDRCRTDRPIDTAKLSALQKRRDRVDVVMRKDMIKLIDKQIDLEIWCRDIAQEISIRKVSKRFA